MSTVIILILVALVATGAVVAERRVRARQKLPAVFKVWGSKGINDPVVKQWVMTLSEKETKQLVSHARRFGKRQNVDIAPLLRDELETSEVLRQKMSEMLVDYVTAAWQRAEIQPDMTAHEFFEAYRRSPKKRKYRPFTTRMHERLIEADLVKAPTGNLSRRKRRKVVRESVLLAAEKHQPAFNAILKETLRAEGMTVDIPDPLPTAA